MQITLIRANERQCYSIVQRDDGVTVRVPGYGRISPIPHDLAHYVIERELQLRQGFWGSVAAGCMFAGMVVLSGRRRPHAEERSQAVMRENARHVTQAEVLVGTLMGIVEQRLDTDPAAARAHLTQSWYADEEGSSLLQHTDIGRVCAALRDAEARWRETDIGQGLPVTWNLSTETQPVHEPVERRRRARAVGRRPARQMR